MYIEAEGHQVLIRALPVEEVACYSRIHHIISLEPAD